MVFKSSVSPQSQDNLVTVAPYKVKKKSKFYFSNILLHRIFITIISIIVFPYSLLVYSIVVITNKHWEDLIFSCLEISSTKEINPLLLNLDAGNS